jgi:hypothetical protein
MGQHYDSTAHYDWTGTYDEGVAVPITAPSRFLNLRARAAPAVGASMAQRGRWAAAMPKANMLRMSLPQPAVRVASTRAKWNKPAELQHTVRLRFDAGKRRSAILRAPWLAARVHTAATRIDVSAAHARLTAALRMLWAEAPAHRVHSTITWFAPSARYSDTRLRSAAADTRNTMVRIRWRPGYPYRIGYRIGIDPDPDSVPPGSTIIIPSVEVYSMQPSLSIIRDSDGADCGAIDATVRLDRRSYAYSLEATIPWGALPLVNPDTNGGPVSVQCWINGYLRRVVIVDYDDNRKFGGTGCKIYGSSPSILLSSRYADQATFTSTAAADASQLAADLMPSGWTVNWNAQDWLVPAGMFSYADLAPIDALAQLANAVGAMILPDPAELMLTVQSLYPDSPWNWGLATPFAEIPKSFWANLAGSRRGAFKDFNGVYVSGQNGGVVGRVKLTGTDGSTLVPTVTDALLCNIDAARERGRVELAKARALKNETARMPVLLAPAGAGNPGIFLPGQLLRVVDMVSGGTISTYTPSSSTAEWLGIVDSIEISAQKSPQRGSAMVVRQNAVLERTRE